jgi:hypothetical protein
MEVIKALRQSTKHSGPFLKRLEEMRLLPIVSFNYLFGKRLTSCIPSITRTKEVDSCFYIYYLERDKDFDLKIKL